MLLEWKKITKSFPLKRKICIFINLYLMKIYDRFRGCSGVKEHTEKKMKEIEKNRNKVAFVNENLPIVIDETKRLQDRNKYLVARVVVMFNELRTIKQLATNKQC